MKNLIFIFLMIGLQSLAISQEGSIMGLEMISLKNASFTIFNEEILKPVNNINIIDFKEPSEILKYHLSINESLEEWVKVFDPINLDSIKKHFSPRYRPNKYFFGNKEQPTIQLLFELKFTYLDIPVSVISCKIMNNEVGDVFHTSFSFFNENRWCLMSSLVDEKIALPNFIVGVLSRIKPLPLYYLLNNTKPDIDPVINEVWKQTRYRNGLDIWKMYDLKSTWKRHNSTDKFDYFFRPNKRYR